MQKENWIVSTIIFLKCEFLRASTDTESDANKTLADSEACEQIPIQEASTNPVKMEDKNGQTSSTVVSGEYSTVLTPYETYNVPQHS